MEIRFNPSDIKLLCVGVAKIVAKSPVRCKAASSVVMAGLPEVATGIVDQRKYVREYADIYCDCRLDLRFRQPKSV